MVPDLRLALKSLRRERAFSVTVFLTLTLVVAANVAIFSVIRAVLLAPLPYDEPESLVTLYNSYPGAGAERASNGSYDYFVRRERVAAFEEVALVQGAGSTVGLPGSAERVATARVTPSLFPLLRVEPALGRAFTEEEMEPGNQYRVVLGDGFWREYFAADPAVVGRELRVDGRPHTIVGVAPPDFRLVGEEEARFFLPFAFGPAERSAEVWHSNSYEMLARLRDGATVEQARAQVAAMNEALIEESPVPDARQLLEDVGFHTVVTPTAEDLVADVRPTLYMLWAGAAFVLLIGCVNIANLMLARARVRQAEVATRLALGAPRVRVVRHLLAESLLLSAAGSAAGLGAGVLGLRLLTGAGVDRLPRGTEVGVDGAVLAFTLLLAVGAGLLFAAIPLLDVLGRDLSAVFRAQGRNATASRGAVVARNALVTGQVALAFVLLVGAGLMLVSFRAALAVEPGFAPGGLATAYLSLPSVAYPDAAARRAFLDELQRAVEAVPGVEAASTTTQLPFGTGNSASVILPEGYAPPPGEALLSPYATTVGPGYFRAMGIRLVEGREFEPGDGPDRPRALVIDEWLARRYWPDRSPLGSRMVSKASLSDSVTEENLYTVVGVVERVKQRDLTTPDGEHVGAYYFAARQRPAAGNALVVRASEGVDPATLVPAVRAAVQRLDPELPLFDVRMMEERISRSLAQRRTPMTLLLVFSGIALFLAVVGIYGALAYAVAHRRREIGIRVALGSAPRDVFRLVLGQGARITGVGLGLGVLGSAALTGVLGSLLFGVRPLDPPVLGAVAAVLGATALLACAVPAWHATRVDPTAALTPE